MGTRERPLQVSQVIIPKLQGAAVGFVEGRALQFLLPFARLDKPGFGLWIIGQTFPLGTPGLHTGFESSALRFGNLARHAILVSRKKRITLRHANLLGCGAG